MALTGDQILTKLTAMANPHRMRILASLGANGRNYISQLARDVGISRPLLHLHIKKLEEAGLVASKYELSDNGKALNFIEVNNFNLELTPENLTRAAKTLTPPTKKSK